jgi:hypothetical protein
MFLLVRRGSGGVLDFEISRRGGPFCVRVCVCVWAFCALLCVFCSVSVFVFVLPMLTMHISFHLILFMFMFMLTFLIHTPPPITTSTAPIPPPKYSPPWPVFTITATTSCAQDTIYHTIHTGSHTPWYYIVHPRFCAYIRCVVGSFCCVFYSFGLLVCDGGGGRSRFVQYDVCVVFVCFFRCCC